MEEVSCSEHCMVVFILPLNRHCSQKMVSEHPLSHDLVHRLTMLPEKHIRAASISFPRQKLHYTWLVSFVLG